MTFKADFAGIGQLLRSPEMEAEMLRRAEKVKAAAIAAAPFDPKSETHYKDAFSVDSTREGGVHKDRAEARVINDDAAAFPIEYGTRDTPRHRTLGTALDAARD